MRGKKHDIDKEPRIVEEDEIDLVEVAKTIWTNRRIVYKTVAVFIVLGLVVAFGSKVEYEASCEVCEGKISCSVVENALSLSRFLIKMS